MCAASRPSVRNGSRLRGRSVSELRSHTSAAGGCSRKATGSQVDDPSRWRISRKKVSGGSTVLARCVRLVGRVGHTGSAAADCASDRTSAGNSGLGIQSCGVRRVSQQRWPLRRVRFDERAAAIGHEWLRGCVRDGPRDLHADVGNAGAASCLTSRRQWPSSIER